MKTVLITGGSRGIGAATARRFAKEGYRVAMNYRNSRDQADQLAQELCGFALQADVSREEMAGAMVEDAVERLGHIDCLVCNAGISMQKLLGDTTGEEWRQMFAVNVDGMFYTIRAVLPHMINRKAGRIITVSSMWGVTGSSCEVAYSASKAAVIGMSRALAKELGPSGITVNCVAPGMIETDMNQNLDAEAKRMLTEETPLGMLGRPEDVAASISFLASEDARFITGQVLSPNGGLVI